MGTYYSTLAMLGIGCGYILSPPTLMNAFSMTMMMDDNDDNNNNLACQFAVRGFFTSNITIGCLGVYAIWTNHSMVRRVAMLAFCLDQSIYLWSAVNIMDDQWKKMNLFPIKANIMIALLLLVVPEEEKEKDEEEETNDQDLKKKKKKPKDSTKNKNKKE
jgi:hypothetical protein